MNHKLIFWWIKKLREFASSQCKNYLSFNNKYCALGILALTYHERIKPLNINSLGILTYFENEDIQLPKCILKELGEQAEIIEHKVMTMNDEDGKTFLEIAEYLEGILFNNKL